MAKLTEQDILNWDGPEEDYMNSDQLAFFRELLVKMQEELIENANTTTGHLQEHESAPDPADRATQEEEYALELRTRDRERKLLNKVQATLRSIDEGDYGFCADTGEPIGLKRLLARPTATLSVEAQERRERNEKTVRRLRYRYRNLKRPSERAIQRPLFAFFCMYGLCRKFD